ncbi:hypothetical protein LXA43DRAFT_457302 [Ganoderma leucocontextum]|nr:hypothetical protein LXA43DRAFT_457302 [Ganoderma leucocontextum]
MASRLRPWCQLVLVLLARGGAASPQNITIDDADDSIQYSGNWKTTCPPSLKYACPDLNKTYNKTLHWVWPPATAHSHDTITVRFTGTGVYVYNVLANSLFHGFAISEVTQANITFTIDGSLVGKYGQSEDSAGGGYLYHSPVYANASLSNAQHVLVITGHNSLVLFDYIIYTSNHGSPPALSPPPSPSSPLPLPSPTPPGLPATFTVTSSRLNTVTVMVPSSVTPILTATDTPILTATASPKQQPSRSTGAIAGGVIGTAVALLLLSVIALFVRRRLSSYRNRKRMGRLLDEDARPHTNDLDHSAFNRSQSLHPPDPALRPSPDVPRSPGHTMSSIPTSPTSYDGEPPSKMFMYDGTVARILEKADRACTEWASSTATKATPIQFGFQWKDVSDEI